MWGAFDSAKSLLKYCRRWSRASFVGNNNRMRLFRLKWVNIWKIPLLIIRPCLREADWCSLYQMVCSMRASLSAPVNTPDGEAAWGKAWGCSQKIHVGTKPPHWEKHSQGLQLKLEEEKALLGKTQNYTDLSSCLWSPLVVALSPAGVKREGAWPAFPGLWAPAGITNTRPWLCYADICPIKLAAIMNDSPYFCNIFFLRTPNNMPLIMLFKGWILARSLKTQ